MKTKWHCYGQAFRELLGSVTMACMLFFFWRVFIDDWVGVVFLVCSGLLSVIALLMAFQSVFLAGKASVVSSTNSNNDSSL